MTTRAAKPIGSTSWIIAEKENVLQVLQQEKEELIYPAQHEMEWLNEHMAEIFARSQFNVADVFKTPGKLRGKTPRTGRKRNVLEPRIPLSDVFSSQPNASPSRVHAPLSSRPAAAFNIALDDQERTQIQSPIPPPKQCTDSGYHGSTGDEMDGDSAIVPSLDQVSKEPDVAQGEIIAEAVESTGGPASAERRTTEGSFHSANENVTAKTSLAEPNLEQDEDKIREQDLHAVPEIGPAAQTEEDLQQEKSPQDGLLVKRLDLLQELDEIGSPSDGSTPDRPLVRKSSLTFASLPPREPLTTKGSFGARESRPGHFDHGRSGRSSYFAKYAANGHVDKTTTDADDCEEIHRTDNSGVDTLMNHKSSIQTLHEKIDMLGKSHASRPSKSIPPAAALAASNLRKSEAAVKAAKEAAAVQSTTEINDDEDDDWIKPLGPPEPARRPTLTKSHTTDVMEHIVDEDTYESMDEMDFDMRAPELIAHEERMRTPVRMSATPGKMPHGLGHAKSASTATLASPAKAEMAPQPTLTKAVSVSNPAYPSTTPQGSPRRILDVPLSASKSKLQSIMKTAKGLFTSSAGVSAAAKMETLSPDALQIAGNNMPGLYPSLPGVLEDKPLPPRPPPEGRKTRGSTEREKEERRKAREMREARQVEEQLEMAREKEKQVAAQYKAHERTVQGQTWPTQTLRKSPRRPVEEQAEVEGPAETHEMLPPAAPTMQGKAQRPMKPTREPAKKNRPQPMSIRVGSTLSQRMPITNASLASTLQDTLPSTNAKQNVVTKKASNASLNSTAPSNPAFKSSGTGQAGKPKALLVAERKKEADEREAQRKLEQKREVERKRVAHQEEARRQEQRQRAEAERKERERVAIEQAKKSAQQQAIEKRRQEQARKLEQQRNVHMAQDNTGTSTSQRGDVGASRPPSRIGGTSTLGKSLVGHNLPTNPAKPAKRPHEDEAGPNRPQAMKQGPGLQQPEAKRRRTEDEGSGEAPSRPTISGAPIRQSNMGKKPSIYPHGYAPAPNGPLINQSQHQPSNPHRIAHPSEISKYPNGNKIPFADVPNPPAYHHHQQQQQYQAHKTPSNQQQKQLPQLPPKSTLQLIKSSPQQQQAQLQPQSYTPGETIALPEIPTDSEDSDSDSDNSGGGDSGFPVPSWVSPNTLTNQLIAQESVDGDAVFGPIAPLRMEEIFAKGNKDRLKKFRERTSSANWALSGDGLTVEEVRVDREMRERMRVQGGWRYGGAS